MIIYDYNMIYVMTDNCQLIMSMSESGFCTNGVDKFFKLNLQQYDLLVISFGMMLELENI